MKTIMRITQGPKPSREIKRVFDETAARLVAESKTSIDDDGILVVTGWFFVPKKVWKLEARDTDLR